MATLEEARAAKEKFLEQLPEGGPHIAVGVGVGSRGYHIAALMQGEGSVEGYPESVDGVPVVYRKIGPIEAL